MHKELTRSKYSEPFARVVLTSIEYSFTASEEGEATLEDYESYDLFE